MLKIVIADDEFPSRQELRALLETNSNLEIKYCLSMFTFSNDLQIAASLTGN